MKLKRVLSIVLSIALVISITAGLDFSANALSSSGSCGTNVTYTFNESTGELVISGTGAMTNYTTSGSPFYNQSDIISAIINPGVTSIGDNAFRDCKGITSVSIPDSITYIGSSAFQGCTELSSVIIPSGVTVINNFTFCGCSNLRDITIPNGVTRIGNYAFYSCINLSSVSIPNSVTEIGNNAYQGCINLNNLTLGTNVNSIGNSAFYGCVSLTNLSIPDSVTSIGSSAFYNCSILERVTLSDSLTNIGYHVFENCVNLKNITIPEGVKSISSSAFQGCKGLTKVIISDSVTGIGDFAFYGCTGIEELIMPASVKIYNSENAFKDCNHIEKVTLTKGTGTMQNYTTYTNTADTYYKYTPWYISRNYISEVVIEDGVTNVGNDSFRDCTGLKSVTISDSVKNIGSSVFQDCTGLLSVTLPSEITAINNFTFCGCSKLSDITIPSGVTRIGNYAFYTCTSLENVVIPDSTKEIGNNAFKGCVGITNLSIGNNVESIGDSAFYGLLTVTNVTIPDKVTSINNSAFYNCSALVDVTMEKNVTSIADSAFGKCPNLETVHYNGTEEDWNNISIGSDNSSLTNANIMYHTHEYVVTDSLEKTCTTDGYIEYTCECGKTYREYSYASHIPEDILTENRVEPTHTEDGYIIYTCISCKEEYIVYPDELKAQGHISGEKVIENRVEPTCTEMGSYTEIVYCSVCEEEISRSNKTIAMLCHSYIENVVPATCTKNGYIAYNCSRCEYSYNDYQGSPSATGHKYGDTVIENNIDVTCTTNGSYDRVVYCTVCNEELSRTTKTVTKLGHISGESKVENYVAPTCTENGSYDNVVRCTRCNEILSSSPYEPVNITVPTTKEILVSSSQYPASPHNYSNNMNQTYSFSYPEAISLRITFSSSTETESGYDYIYLYDSNGSQIGKYDGKTLAGKSFNINGNSFKVKLTSDGSATKYGFSFSSIYATVNTTTTVPDTSMNATGHTNAPAVEENRVEPTCTENGSYDSVIYCANCNEERSRTARTISKLGHNYGDTVIENSIDSTCTENGSYDEVKYCTRCEVELQRNHRIKDLLPHDFGDGYEIRCLDCGTVNTTVYATDACGEDVTYLLNKETGVLLISGNGDMGSDTLFDGFDYYIKSVVIEDGVTSINDNAFYNCYNMESVTIPASVVSIGISPFKGCSRLTEINIDDNNPIYTSGENNDAIIEIASKKIVQAISSTVITEDVVEIGEYAFAYTNIDYLRLPASVTKIDASAFSNCTRLNTIIIPRSVKTIGDNAFEGCYNLYSFYYLGASSAWKKVEKSNIGYRNSITYHNACTRELVCVETVDSNCSEYGYKIYRCEICLKEYTEYLDYGDHVADEPVIENMVRTSCDQDISYEEVYYCTACGVEFERTHKTRPAGHSFVKTDIESEAVNEYTVVHEEMTWADAKAYCEEQGGHLLTINSFEEREAIYELEIDGEILWLGAYCEDGMWKWVTDGGLPLDMELPAYDGYRLAYYYDHTDITSNYDGEDEAVHGFIMEQNKCVVQNYACEYCGETKTEALEHNYEGAIVPPSRTDYGYTLYTCSNCGDEYRVYNDLSLIQSVSFTSVEPIQIVENTHGYWEERYVEYEIDGEFYGEWVSFYVYYDIGTYTERLGSIVTITYTDGVTIDFVNNGQYISEDGDVLNRWYYGFTANQYENPWGLGSDNYIQFSYMGVSCDVPVTIIENPVESIEFIPAKEYIIVENADGSWDSRWNEETGEDEEYFYYYFNHPYNDGDMLVVNNKDGSIIKYAYQDDIDYGYFYNIDDEEDMFYSYPGNSFVDVDSNQYESPWSLGSDNYFQFSYMGVSCDVPVTIIETPVESISFTSEETIKIIENTKGFYREDWDDELETFLEWYCYEIDFTYFVSEGDAITVNYKDGRTVEYFFDNDVSKFVSSDGEVLYDFSVRDDQSFSNQWGIGEHELILNYLGVTTSIPIEIIETNVVDITATQSCRIGTGISEWIGPMFDITVTYNDGISKTYYNAIDYHWLERGADVRIICDDYDGTAGTYEATICYAGFETTAQFEVEEISITDFEITQVKSLNTNIFEDFISENYLELTFTFSDGSEYTVPSGDYVTDGGGDNVVFGIYHNGIFVPFEYYLVGTSFEPGSTITFTAGGIEKTITVQA